jgi:hypothetical protein
MNKTADNEVNSIIVKRSEDIVLTSKIVYKFLINRIIFKS